MKIERYNFVREDSQGSRLPISIDITGTTERHAAAAWNLAAASANGSFWPYSIKSLTLVSVKELPEK